VADQRTGGPILVAVDGSKPSDKALAQAIEMAKRLGAGLRVVTVQDIGLLRADVIASSAMQTLSPTFDAAARETLDAAKAAVAKAGGQAEFAVLPVSEPATSIVREAEACAARLIVVGSHGRTGMARALLGSVAERVVRHAPCSVLVVR
jgi:nucleotide-binding universal stress UspA family protein